MLFADLVNSIGSYGPYIVADPTASTMQPFVDTNLNTILPRIIENAELRMLRDPELDFLAVRQYFPIFPMLVNDNVLPLPINVVVPERLGFYTPAGQTTVFNPLASASPEAVDFFCGAAVQGPQQFYAVAYDSSQGLQAYPQVLLGPTPDAGYLVQLYGTSRPTPMSATNPETWIGDNLPDLFFAAAMIALSLYQKNFAGASGASGPVPQQTVSWEQTYQELKKGAAVEEARKRRMGPGWQPYPPTPVATPPRN